MFHMPLDSWTFLTRLEGVCVGWGVGGGGGGWGVK